MWAMPALLTRIEIGPSSDKTIDSIPVGEVPRRIAVNVQTNTVYVTNQGSKDISVIDGNSKETIETIQVAEPFEIAINSQTNKVYAMYTNSKLSVVTFNHKVLPVSSSPLKQISSGVDPISVICKDGFKLIFKAVDNFPACVKPTTAEKLIQRGWARE